MKIAKELLILTREHHTALSLGNTCVNIAKSHDEKSICALCLKISKNFNTDYAAHFDTEESTIFAFLRHKSAELLHLCEQLTLEHKKLYQLAESLSKNSENLEQFGKLLKSHIRLENRQLFPQIVLLSSSERQAILNLSEKHQIPVKL